MKNKLIYLLTVIVVIFGIVLYSCGGENEEQKDNSISIQRTSNEPLIIGNFDSEGDFIYKVEQSLLLENWNRNLKLASEIEANFTSLEVFEEDGMFYIQARGTEYSSTILLNLNSSGEVTGEGIACTSKICSDSSTKCVPKPDKKSCTKCTNVANDCTKTVSSFALFEDDF